MVPLANILLGLRPRPLAHGAVGFWDEVLNVIPLIFGAGLLAYLYFGKRKRRPADAAQMPVSGPNPPAPPEDPPHA